MSKNKHVARHAAPQTSGFARVTTTVAVTGGLVAGIAVAENAGASSPQSAANAAANTAAATQPLQLKAITPAKSLKAAPVQAHKAATKAPVKVSRSTARAALSAPVTAQAPAATPSNTQAPAPRRHHHRMVTAVAQNAPTATTPRVRHHRARRTLSAPASFASAQTTAAPAPRSTSNVVSIASGLTGIPYVWGGSSTAGFDCSGFVSYVYAQVGIQLPHQSGAIRAMATPVSDPRPGDLVFLPGHVAIYAGNGMVYEAHHPGTPSGLYPLLPGSTFGRIG